MVAICLCAPATAAAQGFEAEVRIDQLQHEINGIESQRVAKHGQLVLIRKELEKITGLYEKKLTSVTRLYALEREEKRLTGEYAGLTAQIARTKGKISETRVQMLAAEQSAKLDAQRELRSTDAKLNELREREIAAADRLRRTVLYAPQSGVVHELAVHTIGGVITSAETVMTIVPADERLTIEARFAPVDIDQINIGRKARLRFSAFNQRTTPEVTGRIVHVSADVSSDPKSSQQYYVGRVKMDADAREALKDLELIPGMPVEVFVSTGSRTALSYLSKPVTDQFNRAFRED